MKLIILLFLMLSSLFANTPSSIINKQMNEIEQRRAFEQRQNEEKKKENLNFDNQLLNIEDDLIEKDCIQIDKINILNNTIFKEKQFKDITKPYLHKCNGIKNLSNLRDKISNKYIDKGYVTSRAYFKLQDLNSKELNINIFEGKIEKIESSSINISNLFINHEDKILNLRDLEVIIQQAERLQSQKLDIQLIPADKEGYTIVKIENQSPYSNYYGNIGVNNYGVEKTGKYQISTNFNYENLFGINDIMSLNLNSTNHAFKSTDNTYGASLNYSFPIDRFLFDIFYNYSNYEQTYKDIDTEFKSDGKNYSYGIDISYKLFHSYRNSLELLLSYEDKNVKNYLNNVKLDLQTYKISAISTGLKHIYKGDSFDYYSKFIFKKAFSGEKDEFVNQETSFKKYILDLGFNKYFNTSNNLKYNFYLRGQYSNNSLFGTEEMNIGGVYTVRGFNDEGLYGTKGFYTRNELSVAYKLNEVYISPYLAIDYGHIEDNRYSLGGSMVGSAIGSRVYYKNFNLELFYSMPLKEADYIKDENSNFFGLSLSYNY